MASSFKAKVQKMGGFLSGMVMPNIGALIAWGIITALFEPNRHPVTMAWFTFSLNIKAISCRGSLFCILYSCNWKIKIPKMTFSLATNSSLGFPVLKINFNPKWVYLIFRHSASMFVAHLCKTLFFLSEYICFMKGLNHEVYEFHTF